ncbi:hypothetical protein CAPTEDRAFT_149793 [Capitella teleta]|uniref:Protein FAM81A n=1 Tax=Capitella teleta TaxID=283909 RepID=R7UIM2_CAPTE|nr:hypothetical protein CAPTEDRAFT_149793 [Capitella teleta]|eukprot:ELU06030.1 hypothetical protein CAPTEDRAFT_149793 [Capitella teleta]
MSRSGRGQNGALLPLRAGGGEEQAWQSPRAPSRLDHLEERLVSQERTTHGLVDRAYKIKEDIIDNLNITHGTWQEEKRSRQLLQEHIRTITDVVRKLSRDIMFLEEQIKSREGYSEGTQSAVKNLEMHHVAGVTDLRGRVARCDAAIARLSGDLKACHDATKALSQQQLENQQRVTEKLQSLEVRTGDILGRLDKWSSQCEIQIRHVENESGQNINALDSRTRLQLEEAQREIGQLKSSEVNEREKLEMRISTTLDKLMQQRDIKTDKTTKSLEDAVNFLSVRLQRHEDESALERDRIMAGRQAYESKVTAMLQDHSRRQAEDLAKLKREMREGFAAVHESISNMKQILDGKRKLLEEQLRKEIGQIRKMVVLI